MMLYFPILDKKTEYNSSTCHQFTLNYLSNMPVTLYNSEVSRRINVNLIYLTMSVRFIPTERNYSVKYFFL